MDLARRTWGAGSRSALLVHGLSSSGEGWWRVGPGLADLGFRVVAPDLRGHGDSERADRFRLSDYATDLLEIEPGWDLVIGHSLGGAAAIEALAERPQWARRLVLLDPALWIASDAEVEADWTASFRRPLTRDAIMEDHPTWHPEDARIKARALETTDVTVVTQTLADNRPWNVVPQLMRTSVPVLVIGADPALGALVPRSLGESLSSLASNLRFEWVPHGSHSMHRDEFDATWKLIEEWLDDET